MFLFRQAFVQLETLPVKHDQDLSVGEQFTVTGHLRYQVVSLPSSAAVASYCNDSDSADGLFQMEISPPETCISGRSLAGGGSAKLS